MYNKKRRLTGMKFSDEYNFLKYVDTLVGNILKDKNNTSLLVRFSLFFSRVEGQKRQTFFAGMFQKTVQRSESRKSRFLVAHLPSHV